MKTLILIAILGLVAYTFASFLTSLGDEASKASEQRIERIDKEVGL